MRKRGDGRGGGGDEFVGKPHLKQLHSHLETS